MMSFWRRRRTLVVMLVLLLVWLSGFMIWADEMTGSPLDEPISLSPAGHVERTIRVRMEGPHELSFKFAFDIRSREQAMALIGRYSPFGQDGQRTRASGIDIPIRWSLTTPSGHTVASGDGSTYGRDGYSATEIYRRIARPIPLTPEYYQFRASISRDMPETAVITAHLQLALPGRKISFGWRSDLLFWGGMANYLFIGPLSLVLALVIASLELRHWLTSRRAQ